LRGKENCSQGRRRIVTGLGWLKYCKKIGNEDESKGRGSKGIGLQRKRIAHREEDKQERDSMDF
jgi:hypothetical protein